MKKNYLTIGLLALSFSAQAQMTTTPKVLCHVDAGATFYVGKGALVYNGGGLQVKDTGLWQNHGNVMVVASDAANDVFRTLTSTGGDKAEGATSGGTIVNKLNEPTAYASVNIKDDPATTTVDESSVYTYGQLYISGVAQDNIKGIVNQEYRNVNHGAYQQIALPFFGKTLSTLSTDLGKTFTTQRWSQNEILKWDNANVIFHHFTNLGTQLSDGTGYYILGNKYNTTLDVSTVTRTIQGVPYADGAAMTKTLQNGGNGLNFGSYGQNTNQYNEKYYSYVWDSFDIARGQAAWNATTFGKNTYQFGNPFLTNLDLRNIFINEGAGGDGVHLTNIYGIRVEQGQGSIQYSQTTGGGASTERFVTWDTANNVPVGSVDWLIVRPGSVFTIKLIDNATAETLDLNKLRRFNYIPRTTVAYSVTAAKNSSSSTVKQLGVIALDANGNELGVTYYAVSPNYTSGHANTTIRQTAAGSNDVIGTYEEAITGGYDTNFTNTYWLNINEANEVDFNGKAIPMVMYSDLIKSLKFEVRENAELVPSGTHNLSAGEGFFYKLANGNVMPISQGQIIPVTAVNSGTEANLYYGQPNSTVLGTQNTVKPSRTMVIFNPQIDQYVVRFDPNWKKADVQVFDMSGKLIFGKDKINTSADFVIELDKANKSVYVVSVTSETGEKINTKIIR